MHGVWVKNMFAGKNCAGQFKAQTVYKRKTSVSDQHEKYTDQVMTKMHLVQFFHKIHSNELIKGTDFARTHFDFRFLPGVTPVNKQNVFYALKYVFEDIFFWKNGFRVSVVVFFLRRNGCL